MDATDRTSLDLLDDAVQRVPPWQPKALDADHLRLLASAEAVVDNQDGADKSWLWSRYSAYRDHFGVAERRPARDPLARFAAALNAARVRYVVIGVWGANYYTRRSMFMTEDQDLFLPPDPDNLLAAWRVATAIGLELWCGDEPLDSPLDERLAQEVARRRALTHATDRDKLDVDLALVMAGFEFDEVHAERRTFRVGATAIPVARLAHIVASKARAGRPKDRLFLASHEDALRKLLARG
jgi:hypothetical protein